LKTARGRREDEKNTRSSEPSDLPGEKKPMAKELKSGFSVKRGEGRRGTEKRKR